MRIVDTRGLLCPKPIIETKKILKETAIGDTFKVLTNSETSLNNLKKFLTDNHTRFTVTKAGEEWTLEITKLEGDVVARSEEEYCSPEIQEFKKDDYVIAITSDCMGQGDEELGRKLMKSFLSVIIYLDALPASVIFYNSGVKLTVKSSPSIEFLLELKNRGVEIIVCGTCIDFYGLGKEIGVGEINDMLTITNRMLSADKVIRP